MHAKKRAAASSKKTIGDEENRAETADADEKAKAEFLASYSKSWSRVTIHDLILGGFLRPGSTVAVSVRNETDVHAKVDEHGALVTADGGRYLSPSSFAAAYGSEGSHSKGWMQVWYLDRQGNGARLSTLKSQFIQAVKSARKNVAGTPESSAYRGRSSVSSKKRRASSDSEEEDEEEDQDAARVHPNAEMHTTVSSPTHDSPRLAAHQGRMPDDYDSVNTTAFVASAMTAIASSPPRARDSSKRKVTFSGDGEDSSTPNDSPPAAAAIRRSLSKRRRRPISCRPLEMLISVVLQLPESTDI